MTLSMGNPTLSSSECEGGTGFMSERVWWANGKRGSQEIGDGAAVIRVIGPLTPWGR